MMADIINQEEKLIPIKPALGLFPNFFAQQNEMLSVKKPGFFSTPGAGFTATLANGEPLLRIGRQNLLRRRKVFDAQNNHLFDLAPRIFHLHNTYVCEDPTGKKLVEAVCTTQFFGGHIITITFTPVESGKEVALTVEGSWVDSRARIIVGKTGPVLACINRVHRFPLEFVVHVAAGADMAFMATMCVFLNDVENAQKAQAATAIGSAGSIAASRGGISL